MALKEVYVASQISPFLFGKCDKKYSIWYPPPIPQNKTVSSVPSNILMLSFMCEYLEWQGFSFLRIGIK